MNWLEISVTTHSEAVEALSEFFIEANSKGVAIEDPQDYFDLTQEQIEFLKVQQADLFDTDQVLVKAYYLPDQWTPDLAKALEAKIKELQSFGLSTGKGSVTVSQLAETDWADAWKKYYLPVRVTRYVTVVPSWIDYQPSQEGEVCIQLDPGLAFGTGTHPTTQLSLLALEQVIRGGETLIDVGTGSGVLAIASKKLGAGPVYAYDIDQVATRVSKENIALNTGMEGLVVGENNLLQGLTIEADLIVANILAEVLVLMPQDAYQVLKLGGKLILSGIIEDKLEWVKEAFLALGFKLVQESKMGQWNCLILEK